MAVNSSRRGQAQTKDNTERSGTDSDSSTSKLDKSDTPAVNNGASTYTGKDKPVKNKNSVPRGEDRDKGQDGGNNGDQASSAWVKKSQPREKNKFASLQICNNYMAKWIDYARVLTRSWQLFWLCRN